ncbi:MAG: alpha/beta hydrolase [Rhizobiaceae bacterium]|nr:alpha/beta hydrolase [Rhizobiaceae bacterium]MCV0406395.1 alpha/beta hydrolase [Rhizobiaceae bacterium]
MRFSPPVACAIMLILSIVLVSGCANPRGYALLDPAVAQTPISDEARLRTVFVATTRARSSEPGYFFSGRRSQTEGFARVLVSIPPVHEPGKLERPRRGPVDPAIHFAAREVRIFETGSEFARSVRSDVADGGDRVLVFVHGYNTRFAEAVCRVSQIAQDADYDGAVVLFTWASAGRLVDYVYDQNSASAARDSLEETLRMLAGTGAKRIDLIAHSMGNWVALEALRQLAISGDRDLGGKLGDVVLAAPDVDLDVFRSQMARYGTPGKPFFVMVSGDDRALDLSRFIAGNRPRLGGDYADAGQIAELGLIVVDVTSVSGGDSLNHTKFADNPVLVRLLGDRLRDDSSLGADERGVEDRLDTLARGVGQTLASTAEIVITTPVEVLKVAVGQ